MPENLKCKFCGREVKETIHSKKIPEGFRVDYYLVWTGDLTPVVMKNPRDEREVMQFFKVDKLRPVVACSECFEKADVKADLERAFKEVPEISVPEENGEKG
jgi:hypothetical protein